MGVVAMMIADAAQERKKKLSAQTQPIKTG
jgi:hypothetical protein